MAELICVNSVGLFGEIGPGFDFDGEWLGGALIRAGLSRAHED